MKLHMDAACVYMGSEFAVLYTSGVLEGIYGIEPSEACWVRGRRGRWEDGANFERSRVCLESL